MSELVPIRLAYASPTQQTLKTIDVSLPCSVSEVIKQSDILTLFPEIDLNTQAVGIWGERVTLETQVKAGDRVEIYRPLIVDPMTWRRKRVEPKPGRVGKYPSVQNAKIINT